MDGALHRLLTPAWVVPQLLNVCGSLLFAWSLGFSSISVAGPVANGGRLAASPSRRPASAPACSLPIDAPRPLVAQGSAWLQMPLLTTS